MLVPIELINCAFDKVAFGIELYQSKQQHELDWSIKGKHFTYKGDSDALVLLCLYRVFHYLLAHSLIHRSVTIRFFHVVIDHFMQKAGLAYTWPAQKGNLELKVRQYVLELHLRSVVLNLIEHV